MGRRRHKIFSLDLRITSNYCENYDYISPVLFEVCNFTLYGRVFCSFQLPKVGGSGMLLRIFFWAHLVTRISLPAHTSFVDVLGDNAVPWNQRRSMTTTTKPRIKNSFNSAGPIGHYYIMLRLTDRPRCWISIQQQP